MTKAIYIIGAAGTGKSTLLNTLLDDRFRFVFGEPETLHRSIVGTHRVRFRGQRLYSPETGEETGVYFGVRRAEYPGTDACDKVCGPVAREWLEGDLPPLLFGEGMRFTNRPFLDKLRAEADLLVYYLTAPPEALQERFAERGSDFPPSFVSASATRARNVAEYLEKKGVPVEHFDTTEWGPEEIATLAEADLS